MVCDETNTAFKRNAPGSFARSAYPEEAIVGTKSIVSIKNNRHAFNAMSKVKSPRPGRETQTCINLTIHSKIGRSVIFHCNDFPNVKVLR